MWATAPNNALDHHGCRVRRESASTHGQPLPSALFIQSRTCRRNAQPPKRMFAEMAEAAGGGEDPGCVEKQLLKFA